MTDGNAIALGMLQPNIRLYINTLMDPGFCCKPRPQIYDT